VESKHHGEIMKLVCDGATISFDQRIVSSNGFLLETAYTHTVTACTVCTTSTEIQAKDLHERLGHVNDDCMRLTAKHLGWEITGVLDVCEACAVGKAKQKSIPKSVDTLYSRPDELMFIDIAGFQQPSKGGKDSGYCSLIHSANAAYPVLQDTRASYRTLDLM
jgi:hypothetical protein